MGLYLGTNAIRSLYLGENKVKAVYLGTQKVYASAQVLPAAYQRVAYLGAAANGGAYIDLGIRFEHAADIEIGYLYQGASSYSELFGAYERSGSRYCEFIAEYTESTVENTSRSFFYTRVGGSSSLGQALYPLSANRAVGDEVRLKFSLCAGENITVQNLGENTSYTNTNYRMQDYAISLNLYLFGFNQNGTYSGRGTKQITRFRYTDQNGTLLRDMVPCRRLSDQTPGMYDFASAAFFPNSGSSSFTPGPALT